ncbi:MAG: hypothetical protein GX096_03875 [Clostridiales bacterium]|nr:hypothetical protein [Clostridiales bacterium]
MMKLGSINRSLRVNLANVVTAPNFWISAMLLFGVLFAEVAEGAFLGPWRMADQSGFGDAYYFNISLHFGYYIYAAPLACAFAASGMFVSDLEAGFYRLRLMKSGRREYQYGLFLGTTIGGGLALMVGVLLFAVACSIIYLPYYPATDLVAPQAWLPMLKGQMGNWNFMLVSALLAFLFGMVWSGVGLAISVLSPNRYVSYLAPFIICFCAVLALPKEFQPLEMLVQMSWYETFTFPKLIRYQAVLYFTVMAWFRYAFERRVIRGQG